MSSPSSVPAAVVAPADIADQLGEALAAARRMGWVPVVGLLATDQIVDLNDACTAANLLVEGTYTGSATEGLRPLPAHPP